MVPAARARDGQRHGRGGRYAISQKAPSSERTVADTPRRVSSRRTIRERAEAPLGSFASLLDPSHKSDSLSLCDSRCACSSSVSSHRPAWHRRTAVTRLRSQPGVLTGLRRNSIRRVASTERARTGSHHRRSSCPRAHGWFKVRTRHKAAWPSVGSLLVLSTPRTTGGTARTHTNRLSERRLLVIRSSLRI